MPAFDKAQPLTRRYPGPMLTGSGPGMSQIARMEPGSGAGGAGGTSTGPAVDLADRSRSRSGRRTVAPSGPSPGSIADAGPGSVGRRARSVPPVGPGHRRFASRPRSSPSEIRQCELARRPASEPGCSAQLATGPNPLGHLTPFVPDGWKSSVDLARAGSSPRTRVVENHIISLVHRSRLGGFPRPGLGSSRLIRSGEFIDLAIRALPDPLIAGIEMACQVPVVFEPPGRRTGDDEETGSSGSECLQMGDGLAAVRGVMAGIVAPIVLREMPHVLPFNIEQVRVSLADHDDPGGRWEETAHVSSDSSNHPQVIDCSAQTRDHGLDLVLPPGDLISNLEHRGRATLLARSIWANPAASPSICPLSRASETAAHIVYSPGPIAGAFPCREPFRQSRSQ